MVRFSLFGIPVQIQPFFWVTLAAIGGALWADSQQAVLHTALFMLAGFFSILIHELGHALTGRKFGAYSSITLEAFGGYASFSGTRFSRLQHFLVTAAGPAIQILLGIAVWFAIEQLPRLNDDTFYFLRTLRNISLFWALLNLLPVIPLDGGHMLNAILGPKRIKITLRISIVVAILVGLTLFRATGSLLFPIFLGIFAWQAYQALRGNLWR
jgi:Zn-dependent protease